MTLDDMIRETKGIPTKDVILYHGSRGGIDGDIQPISRARCDFGRGFYMGEDKNQAAGMVVDASDPYLYKLKLNLSQIPPERILVLKDREWLYTVLACRKRCPEFDELDIAKRAIEKLGRYDVAIGPIADDRMTEAIRRFENKALTDKALLECLQYVNYGDQYVCLTQRACNCVEQIEKPKELYGQELDQIKKYSEEMRRKGASVVDQMQIKYQRDGMFLNELVDEQLKKKVIDVHVR